LQYEPFIDKITASKEKEKKQFKLALQATIDNRFNFDKINNLPYKH